MNKFKIGDKVKVIKSNRPTPDDLGEIGTIVEANDVIRDNIYIVDFGKHKPFTWAGEKSSCRYYRGDEIELITSCGCIPGNTWQIIIKGDENTSRAKYIVGKQVVKEATAKRHPDDIHDASVATKVLVDRLFPGTFRPTAEGETSCERVANNKSEQPHEDWREWILTNARNAVCTDRNKKYGEPENSFAAIAKLWTAYLQASGKMDEDINIYDNDAALMLAMFKIAREITAISPNPDSYTDIAGYAACAGECALNGDGQTL